MKGSVHVGAAVWTYGEARGRGPGSLAGGIADDGLVDVTSANEAATERLEILCMHCRAVFTSGRRMLVVQSASIMSPCASPVLTLPGHVY